MEVPEADGCTGIHVVDTELLGVPGFMSAYVVDAERPAVVDPGPATGADRVLAALEALEIPKAAVEHVLPTHVHLDHAGATGALARACPNATVRVHERGRPYLVDADRLERLAASARRAVGDVADEYGEPATVQQDRCEALSDGAVVDLGDRHLRAIHAPGHAPHQVALLDSRDGALFAGDAAGMAVAGGLWPSTPAPDFDLAESVATVERLLEADPSVVCYGHFGARTDAADSLARYRDRLPEWVGAVETAVAEHGRDAESVTSALRPDWPSPTLERDVAGVLRYLAER